MSGVSSQHPEFDANIFKWTLVRDVVNSDVVSYIKDIETGDVIRNERYKDDARLTNFTSRTRNGLVGAVFAKPIEIDLPTSIDYLVDDATGNRMGLEKLAQGTLGEVLQAGRYGLLTDFPASEDGLTASEQSNLNLKARIYRYKPESIINWQSNVISGAHTLTLVVLKELVAGLEDNGFTWTSTIQYRVLRLIDGVYVQQIYDHDEELVHEYTPRDFNGNRWTEIPFVFVGAEDNDAEVDPGPLYDLAELNIGHLRNSADYEESIHVSGQPTLMLTTSFSAESFKEANPDGIKMGSRRGYNLGESGSATMLQPNPNQLADVAMQRKEEQAVMIGARLVQPTGSNETAEAARIKHSGENSVLSTITNNVNDAINQCIRWTLTFMDKNPEQEFTFVINKTFFDQAADAQVLIAQMQLFTNGIIASKDIRSSLRKTGLIAADRTDDDIDADIANTNPLL